MVNDESGVLPTLLRGARATYSRDVKAALVEAGCDDVPRNGAFVLGAISRTGSPLGQIIDWLGISKQAAGQLVDSLVTRGYLLRAPDPDDRRRLSLTLTERGEHAAAAAHQAGAQIETALVNLVGVDDLRITRATLSVLASLGLGEGVPGYLEKA
jgi:DNA-binding MarR family transcriptional regulator